MVNVVEQQDTARIIRQTSIGDSMSKVVLRDENGNTLGGDDIDDDDIPVCYRFKIELIEECGIDKDMAKLVGIYGFAFPEYSKFFGGVWVAS